MGNMSGSYGSHYTLWLEVKTNSQSIDGNYSNVTVNLYLQFDGSSYYSYTNNATSGSITVDGTANSYSISSISFSSGVKKDLLLASWTGNVGHNADGTKSLTVSASWDTNTSRIGSGSVSTTVSLTTINRYANFTSLKVQSKTVNSITFAYTTDRAANIFISTDGEQSYLNKGQPVVSNTTSGTITVKYSDWGGTTRLLPDTQYTFRFVCRNATASVDIDTKKDLTERTYAIGKMTAAPDVNIGSSIYITFSNPSGTTIKYFVEAIYKDDSEHKITVRDVTDVTGKSNETIVLTNDELSKIYNLIPHLNQCTLRYGIRTFCDGISYDHYIDKTGYIVNSNPIFSNFTYEDVDETILGLTGNNQIIVKGYSDVKAIISTANKATSQNGATMKTYKLIVGDKSATKDYSSSEVSLSVSNVANKVIQVYATDSRGNATKVEKTVANYKEYFSIAVLSMSAIRENNVGETVTLTFKVKFWNESFGSVANAITSCFYKYKKASESAYKDGATELTYTIDGNELTGSLGIKGDTDNQGFDISEAYNIQLYVADKLTNNSSNPYTITLGSGNPALAIFKNRVGIGKKYDEDSDEALQVGGNVSVEKSSGGEDTGYFSKRTDTGTEVWMGVGSGGINHGVYSKALNKWMMYGDSSEVYLNGYALFVKSRCQKYK